MLNLANVLELIDDRLDERSLAEQQPVGEMEELMAHVRAQFGDETESMGDQEALSKGSRDVAFVAKEASEETPHQTRRRTPVVGVAGSKAQREQLAAVSDDQMPLEPIEPAHRRLAAPGVDPKDAVLRDPRWMADRQRRGVDAADP